MEKDAVKKELIVGLLVIVKVGNEGMAVLQRRGEFNHEKMGPESWPGGCQVTVLGGGRAGETPLQAMWREISEELGERVTDFMLLRNFLVKLLDKEEGNQQKKIFGVIESNYLLTIIRLHPSTGGLVLLPESKVEEIQDLTQFDKKEGVTDRKVIAMFPDEIEAVRKAFEQYHWCEQLAKKPR